MEFYDKLRKAINPKKLNILNKKIEKHIEIENKINLAFKNKEVYTEHLKVKSVKTMQDIIEYTEKNRRQ